MKFSFSDVLTLIKWLGTLISGLITIDKNKNKKVEPSEIFSLIIDVSDIQFFSTTPRIRDTIRKLVKATPEERVQLIDQFGESFDIPNDELEEKIETLVSLANNFGTTLGDMLKRRV